MKEKESIHQIMEQWKGLSNAHEKEQFLIQLKEKIDAKDDEALVKGMKAITEIVENLHSEVAKQPNTAI